MALRATERSALVCLESVHPEYRQVLDTYLRPQGVDIRWVAAPKGTAPVEEVSRHCGQDAAAVLVQSPNFLGGIESLRELAQAVHQAGALLVVAVNPVSLGVLEAPGVCGADIAVGDVQPLGIPMAYGGPHAGFLACQRTLARRMPGRIAGRACDSQGRWGFVLTLQGREQHIRRQRATSNICTNQALCALTATIHLSLLGKEGFRQLSLANLEHAHRAAGRIAAVKDFSLAFDHPFFNEFVVRCPADPRGLDRFLWQEGILGGLPLGKWYPQWKDCMLFCVTEKRTDEEIGRLVSALERWRR
jgi:glycine dehydrogenase subunit 1